MNQTQSPTLSSSDSPPILEAINISKSYKTAGDVVKSVNLKLFPGQWAALMGPSGSGKTTLLSILAGLETPTTGSLHWSGAPLQSASDDERAILRRKHLGFVFQNFQLIPDFTVLENVSLPLELLKDSQAIKKATTLITRLGLSHRMHFFPQTLSGGEQQRVALARAIVHRPKLFLADEPTGNLDSKNAAQFLELLNEVRSSHPEMAGLIVTHDLSLASRFTQVFEIFDGQIVNGQIVNRSIAQNPDPQEHKAPPK